MGKILLSEIDIDDLASLLFEKIKPLVNSLSQNNTPAQPGDEFLSRKEVAAKFKLTTRTIQSMTKKGKIKAYRFGRRVLYKQIEIDKMLSLIKTSVAK